MGLADRQQDQTQVGRQERPERSPYKDMFESWVQLIQTFCVQYQRRMIDPSLKEARSICIYKSPPAHENVYNSISELLDLSIPSQPLRLILY